MPVPLLNQFLNEGLSSIPFIWPILRALPWLALLYILKTYFSGAANTAGRQMHGKVVILVGGTSGIGASIAFELASRGAQLVLLTRHTLSDPFLQDFVGDLRERTRNELITAEHCDLESLHSIRQFATKWVDNAPPRRLDAVVLCANVRTPSGAEIDATKDGVEAMWGVNYLASFHLMSILSPALRAQPADRDVRVVMGVCGAYVDGKIPSAKSSSPGGGARKASSSALPTSTSKPRGTLSQSTSTGPAATFSARSTYATSHLSLATFAHAFQKHLSSYQRPDKLPTNTSVLLVDPGLTRTPNARRALTRGSLWGLAGYLLTYPFWWLILKSPESGAQSFLYACMDESLRAGSRSTGEISIEKAVEAAKDSKVRFVKECSVQQLRRKETMEDEACQKGLWEYSEAMIQKVEKESALRRTQEKKKKESERGSQMQENKPQSGTPVELQEASANTGRSGRSRKT